MHALQQVKPAVWISRSELLKVLSQAALDAGVKIKYSCDIDTMALEGDNVVVRGHSGDEEIAYSPKLLLGCDGVGSKVRNFLQEWSGDDDYSPRKLPSPASGLMYKMLALPPDFQVKRI